MASAALDRLVRSGKLKEEPPAKEELIALLHSGEARLRDAANASLALESRFDLAYNAAHSLSLAAALGCRLSRHLLPVRCVLPAFCQVLFVAMTRDEILSKTRAQSDFLRQLHVRELALFGSYARGEARGASDIDFFVEFDEASFDDYMSVKEFLESLLGQKIDLVLKNAIKPRLRDAILREAVRAA